MNGLGVFTVSGTVVGTETFDYFIYDISDGTIGTTEQITIQETTFVSAGVGSYALTGIDATIKIGEVISAGTGAYTLTGQDALTLFANAGQGVYTLIGKDAGLDVTATVLVGESGAYVLSGAPISEIVLLKNVSCTLVSRVGTSRPNLSNISWAWFDQTDPSIFIAPTDKGSIESTDSAGSIRVLIPGSTLVVGATGTLVLKSDDGLLLGAYNLDVDLS